jgi:glutathione S-transferase
MLELYIASKNYSSWSLRPWLAMTHFGVPFKEIHLKLFSAEFRQVVSRVSPARRVPVLVDDGFAVWDSLAIVEYLAEKFPELPVWPRDSRDRARARSICAEMHAGFQQLRTNMPMNIEAELHGRGWNVAVQRDIDRICDMWGELLAAHGDRFLFGEFSAADAYFAPVCARFACYRPALPARIVAYVERIYALPAMQRWITEAKAVRDFIPEDEPYRLPPPPSSER